MSETTTSDGRELRTLTAEERGALRLALQADVEVSQRSPRTTEATAS